MPNNKCTLNILNSYDGSIYAVSTFNLFKQKTKYAWLKYNLIVFRAACSPALMLIRTLNNLEGINMNPQGFMHSVMADRC